MRPEMEHSLLIEFDELFALRDRLRAVADQVRARFVAAGFIAPLETEVFDEELELRGTDQSRLLVRLDSYHLEITGAPPELQTHLLAAILLDEAGAFRLNLVELGYNVTVKLGRGRSLDLMARAFSPLSPGGEPMLDRQFSMSWDWSTATTGYSFQAADREDKELFISFKAREGYLSLQDLQAGAWMIEQAARFDTAVSRFFEQLGWNG